MMNKKKSIAAPLVMSSGAARVWSALLLLLVLLLAACTSWVAAGPGTSHHRTPTPTAGSVIVPAGWPGAVSKLAGCLTRPGGLPDAACTPGVVLASGTVAAICRAGYAAGVRNVPQSEKDAAYKEYGIVTHAPGQYEVDHLISIELGGSNALGNLWPERAIPTPGFHEKDQVENYLHAQVCTGKLTLVSAQYEIATNWRAVYASIAKEHV